VAFPKAIAGANTFPPLEIHSLTQEMAKVGSDMYISLALANMRIYLVGGLILALVAILAIAMANYSEDRRTLGLLRIRGASPASMRRFVLAMLLSPALVGLALGATSAVLAGFGLANYVWKLREIRTVVQLLPTHLVISVLTAWIALLLVLLLVGVATGFSWWVYRHTAHRSMQGA
jgi:ABC-type lipoprotein release transport system permease subunit